MDDSFEILQDEKKQKPSKKLIKNKFEIIPKKDWHIVCNEHDIKIIKGEKIIIPEKFYGTLITEKVI